MRGGRHQIHFVGIGGIGMSGIAEVLLNLGYKVQGSDASENANVKRLSEKGASVHIGHDAKNLGDAAVVVAVSAPHRPEAFEAARFCIDTLKESAPIWKRETWSDGTDWGTAATAPVPPATVPSVGGGRS